MDDMVSVLKEQLDRYPIEPGWEAPSLLAGWPNGFLIKVIQELVERVEKLEDRVSALDEDL